VFAKLLCVDVICNLKVNNKVVRVHLTVGLSQHSSATSSLIMADWPLHCTIHNFKRFFLPLPMKFQRRNVRYPPPQRDGRPEQQLQQAESYAKHSKSGLIIKSNNHSSTTETHHWPMLCWNAFPHKPLHCNNHRNNQPNSAGENPFSRNIGFNKI